MLWESWYRKSVLRPKFTLAGQSQDEGGVALHSTLDGITLLAEGAPKTVPYYSVQLEGPMVGYAMNATSTTADSGKRCVRSKQQHHMHTKKEARNMSLSRQGAPPPGPHAEVGHKRQVGRDGGRQRCVRRRPLRQLVLRKVGDGGRVHRHHLLA